jgi:uncharacterized protein (DUF1501 family)
VLRLGLGGLAGLAAAGALRRAQAAPAAPRARAMIVLWMNGGPSHLDTWDPKPGTAAGGPFKAIRTPVGGLELSEHMPAIAALAGRLAVVRSMSTREGNHERAQILMHTGYPPNPTVAYPSLGAWAARRLSDPASDLPAFVSISGPSIGGGSLGVDWSPLVVQNPSRPPANVALPPLVDAARFERRRMAVEWLDAAHARQTGDAKIRARQGIFGKAIRLMKSPRLEAFDVGKVGKEALARYGDSDFGRGCALARRLVGAGVRVVEVVLDGWDTHQNNFERVKTRLGTLDPAMSALISDLEAEGQLGHTLVVCLGEFGRTPTINGNEGRDHFPAAWSLALAGGGVRPGIVYGKTNATGSAVVERPVAVADLFATLATLLGLDPADTFITPSGRPVALTQNGKPIAALMAG